ARVAVHHRREVVDRLLLLLVERARHVDGQPVVNVSPALAVELGRALTAQSLHGAVLGAGGNADALCAGQRGYLHGRAADRLGDRDGHVHLEGVALAPEPRRFAHAGNYVHAAGRSPATAGLALAGEPHSAAVLHARRDVHPVALDLSGLAAALAGRAGIGDLRAGAAAQRARL